jgi:hypothetical protein
MPADARQEKSLLQHVRQMTQMKFAYHSSHALMRGAPRRCTSDALVHQLGAIMRG